MTNKKIPLTTVAELANLIAFKSVYHPDIRIYIGKIFNVEIKASDCWPTIISKLEPHLYEVHHLLLNVYRWLDAKDSQLAYVVGITAGLLYEKDIADVL